MPKNDLKKIKTMLKFGYENRWVLPRNG